jgi:hypothetical protein
MVSRYWIATLVSPEETSTQVRVVFDQALVDQGLDELLTDDRLDLDTDDPARPILLAVSDNGPAMTSVDTRAYMAMMAIAQHHGRPHTPTDQAGSRRSSGTSSTNGPTCSTSPILPCSKPNSTASASTTTRSGCTKRSATSPHTTNTTAKEKPSARPAGKASPEPARPGSSTTAGPPPTSRGDTMTWFISKPTSAEDSDTPQHHRRILPIQRRLHPIPAQQPERHLPTLEAQPHPVLRRADPPTEPDPRSRHRPVTTRHQLRIDLRHSPLPSRNHFG